MKDEMISKKKFQPGDKFILEIGEKRTALDEYEIVGTDLWVWGSLLEKLTPYEPDHNVEISKMVNGDAVSRQAAINIVVFECGEWTGLAKEISKQLRQLSPAQPDIIRCKDCKYWRSNTEFCSTFTELNVVHRMPPNGFCSCAERREE